MKIHRGFAKWACFRRRLKFANFFKMQHAFSKFMCFRFAPCRRRLKFAKKRKIQCFLQNLYVASLLRVGGISNLKNFEKIFLEPGESKKVQFDLYVSDLSLLCTDTKSWQVEPAEYIFEVGASAGDIRESASVWLG